MMKRNLVSIVKYAQLCEMHKQSIYNRIEAGTLKTVKMSFGLCIDIDKFPPQKEHLPVGRPTIEEKISQASK